MVTSLGVGRHCSEGFHLTLIDGDGGGRAFTAPRTFLSLLVFYSFILCILPPSFGLFRLFFLLFFSLNCPLVYFIYYFFRYFKISFNFSLNFFFSNSWF